jgi:DNA polymerase IV
VVGRSQVVPRGRDPRFGPDADDAGCTILHVDMDAFFASVEIRARPELRGKPVIVGGLGPRGVVSAASYEARRYGVGSAMPMARARALCPRGVFLPVDGAKVGEASHAAMQIFRDVTPLVEPLSVDEAFLDVAGAQRLLGRPAEIAARIRGRMVAEQGLTCSVGVAPTKFVAKLGSTRAKPDGMVVVPAGLVLDFLHPLPVAALWGVGEKAAETLHRLGLNTIGELANAPWGMLRRAVGEASAAHLHELSWGRDPRKVEPEQVEKSIGAEMTFDTDVSDPALLRRSMLALSEKVGARLRASGNVGRTVSIKVRLADFRTVNRSRTIATSTDVAREIFETSWALFRALGPTEQIRLIGVRVEGLTAAATTSRQLTLGEPEHGWREAEAAADAIAARFGRASVGPASLLGRSDLRRTENHPYSTVVPLSDPPTPS